jgi:hypothetical protein
VLGYVGGFATNSQGTLQRMRQLLCELIPSALKNAAALIWPFLWFPWKREQLKLLLATLLHNTSIHVNLASVVDAHFVCVCVCACACACEGF